MSSVTFGSGRQLYVDIGQPSMIHLGAGINQLRFPVVLDARNTIGGGVPISLTGHAWLGPAQHDYLGPFTTAQPIATCSQRCGGPWCPSALGGRQGDPRERHLAWRGVRVGRVSWPGVTCASALAQGGRVV